jgi:hypothetical protein
MLFEHGSNVTEQHCCGQEGESGGDEPAVVGFCMMPSGDAEQNE